MCLVISDEEYQEAKRSNPILMDRIYTEKGVKKILIGFKEGWYSRVTEWGEKTEIKQCPSCNEFHSKHSPPLCFGCATGRK